MKILINDHSGHGFTLSLSKELAREHVVLHSFSENFQSPKGYLVKLPTDPPNLSFVPLVYKKTFHKYSLIKRALQERKYAAMLNKVIDTEKPDIIICANTPLVAQQKILSFCRKRKIPFILWFQDIYSVAIKKIAIKKLGFLGHLVAAPFEFLEKSQLRNSNCIVSITDDFSEQFKKWNVRTSNFVVPNWSPIEEIEMVSKANEFSKSHGLENSFNIVYSGTMGFKHNPQLIVQLTQGLSHNADIKIVVVSEGLGASYLQKQKTEKNLSNLVILPFQPFERFSQVLSTADIFLAMLEADAGTYSVPSKVLSYLCAGKPIVVAAPANNLASKIVSSSNSGKCVENSDIEKLLSSVLEIKENQDLCALFSRNARNYAEENFQIEKISKSFTHIIQTTLK
jgi:colanic acid biosynthesis glycosyl transferase WcaI